eukprot:CAMPEP_0117686130 /NCGR_PEP_ID=MMETSP0804-20121206/22236_1 /TAXON_ID=1074897 /ORGANISM="Tetraselmis astigmatica, Strain CCMP880" /LENGTH=117 /DNA_ID=CAMNT_0005497703 /DNA_START=511 /DNA_END=865 /DNA_ORIENTATION=+
MRHRDKVEWKTTPFSGRISHHDQKPRRSERGMHKILEEAVEEIDVVNPNGEVSNTLKHVMNANFKSSTDEGEPESYGGQHGFSGDVPGAGATSETIGVELSAAGLVQVPPKPITPSA